MSADDPLCFVGEMGLLDAAAAMRGEHNQVTVTPISTPHSTPAEVDEVNKAVSVVTEVSEAGAGSEEGSSSSSSSSSSEVKGQEVTSAQTFVIAATEIQVIEWDKVSQYVNVI